MESRRSSVFSDEEWEFASAISRFSFINPFDEDLLRESLDGLAQLRFSLGEIEERVPTRRVAGRPRIEPLVKKAESLTELTFSRLQECSANQVTEDESLFYCDLVMHTLYYKYRDAFHTILMAQGKLPGVVASTFGEFLVDYRRYHSVVSRDTVIPADRMFACFFQIRRAYHHIDSRVFGQSRPMKRLRAAIWNSIFTCDFRLFGQVTFDRMHDIASLITGPSGTGKELVAQAIGLSRYIPFDAQRMEFAEPFGEAFHSINLSALSPTLIESEMFGHCEGAFSGAVRDRVGWFERCRTFHTVFLDEIGELDEQIQVKLLRVLQSRRFERVGEIEQQEFNGKVIAATNRSLAAEIDAGHFRADLYYRLCSDMITTPSLREQLDDLPDELEMIVQHVCSQVLGIQSGGHVDKLAADVVSFIRKSPKLGQEYRWPGNFRELEQCVRNILVRGAYHPVVLRAGTTQTAATPMPPSPLDEFLDDVRYGRLTMEQLLERYCSLVYARTENYAETARLLDKHQATVRHRIKSDLVTRYRG